MAEPISFLDWLASLVRAMHDPGEVTPRGQRRAVKKFADGDTFIYSACDTGPWHKSWGRICPNCSGAD